jgi:hypothetical protein
MAYRFARMRGPLLLLCFAFATRCDMFCLCSAKVEVILHLYKAETWNSEHNLQSVPTYLLQGFLARLIVSTVVILVYRCGEHIT